MLKLDGVNTRFKTFAWPIGARLIRCSNLHVALFEFFFVSWTLEMKKIEIVRMDQNYFFDIRASVSTRQNSLRLESRKSGPIVLPRWIAIACRIVFF